MASLRRVLALSQSLEQPAAQTLNLGKPRAPSTNIFEQSRTAFGDPSAAVLFSRLILPWNEPGIRRHLRTRDLSRETSRETPSELPSRGPGRRLGHRQLCSALSTSRSPDSTNHDGNGSAISKREWSGALMVGISTTSICCSLKMSATWYVRPTTIWVNNCG